MERERCWRPENSWTKINGWIAGGLHLFAADEWDPIALYSLWVYQLEFRFDTYRCDASQGQGVLTQVDCMVKTSL